MLVVTAAALIKANVIVNVNLPVCAPVSHALSQALGEVRNEGVLHYCYDLPAIMGKKHNHPAVSDPVPLLSPGL